MQTSPSSIFGQILDIDEDLHQLLKHAYFLPGEVWSDHVCVQVLHVVGLDFELLDHTLLVGYLRFERLSDDVEGVIKGHAGVVDDLYDERAQIALFLVAARGYHYGQIALEIRLIQFSRLQLQAVSWSNRLFKILHSAQIDNLDEHHRFLSVQMVVQHKDFLALALFDIFVETMEVFLLLNL